MNERSHNNFIYDIGKYKQELLGFYKQGKTQTTAPPQISKQHYQTPPTENLTITEPRASPISSSISNSISESINPTIQTLSQSPNRHPIIIRTEAVVPLPDIENTPPIADRPGNEPIGFLSVHVSTAKGALPVEDAVVTIIQPANEAAGIPKDKIIDVLITDDSGITPTISLVTPPESLSESPGNIQPYSTYNVSILAKGYYPVLDIGVPIFESVKFVLPVNLTPLKAYEENPNQVIINTIPPNDLN